MKIRNVRIFGHFDSMHDTMAAHGNQDISHRTLLNDIEINYQYKKTLFGKWHDAKLKIPAGTDWDGEIKPDVCEWLIPRWGIFTAAACVFSNFSSFKLDDGYPMDEFHAGMLYFNMLKHEGRGMSVRDKAKLIFAREYYDMFRR